MRDLNDIKRVRFTLQGALQLDLEELESDVVWAQITRGLDLTDPMQFVHGIREYVRHYLSREAFPSATPGTCGPADFFSIEVEVVKDGGDGDETNT